MTYMGLAVCRRRTVVKRKLVCAGVFIHRLLKNAVLFPKLGDFLFPLYEIERRVNFFVHRYSFLADLQALKKRGRPLFRTPAKAFINHQNKLKFAAILTWCEHARP